MKNKLDILDVIFAVRDFGLSHGKVFASIFGFALAFVLTALACAVIFGLMLMIVGGGPEDACVVVGSSIGCCVGVGILSAFLFADMHDWL